MSAQAVNSIGAFGVNTAGNLRRDSAGVDAALAVLAVALYVSRFEN